MLAEASPLLAARGFDLTKGVTIDWMHVVCLGIVRSMLDNWLTARSEGYFIGDKVLYL